MHRSAKTYNCHWTAVIPLQSEYATVNIDRSLWRVDDAAIICIYWAVVIAWNIEQRDIQHGDNVLKVWEWKITAGYNKIDARKLFSNRGSIQDLSHMVAHDEDL